MRWARGSSLLGLFTAAAGKHAMTRLAPSCHLSLPERVSRGTRRTIGVLQGTLGVPRFPRVGLAEQKVRLAARTVEGLSGYSGGFLGYPQLSLVELDSQGERLVASGQPREAARRRGGSE